MIEPNRKDRMLIPKLFWAPEKTYPNWPYKDRRAVGYHLDKSYSRNESIYRFQYKDMVYEISREKAQILGRKFQCFGGVCPHLIPIAEMDRVYSLNEAKKDMVLSSRLF